MTNPIHQAWALFEEGKLEQAEQLYRQQLEANPKHEAALHGLGYVLAEQKRFEEAEGCYLELLNLARHRNDPIASHRAIHQLGMVQRIAGRYEEALVSFQTEAEIMLNEPLAISANAYEQGYIHLKLGDYAEAEGWMEKAVQNALASGDKIALGCALRGTGELFLAMGILRDAQGFLEQAKAAFLEGNDPKGAADVEGLLESI
jgi:tetratricopeptide (TPR) repeat protein